MCINIAKSTFCVYNNVIIQLFLVNMLRLIGEKISFKDNTVRLPYLYSMPLKADIVMLKDLCTSEEGLPRVFLR